MPTDPCRTPFRRLRRALRAELRAIRRDWRTAGTYGYPYPGKDSL